MVVEVLSLKKKLLAVSIFRSTEVIALILENE